IKGNPKSSSARGEKVVDADGKAKLVEAPWRRKDRRSFGMIERGGQVVIHLVAHVKQKTIEPLMKDTIASGTLVCTDESSIYAPRDMWGYEHKSDNHGGGECARDDDGDGLCEVHVNTMEGVWSLLRSWLRPHRGISQEKLPLYLGFFEFVHNVHKRDKALLGSLIGLLVSEDPGIQ